MKKKAVVVLYSPREILEFLWYYCTYGKEYEWTAICALYGGITEYQVNMCKKIGIFSDIICDTRDFLGLSLFDKMKLFFEMGVFYIAGQRKKMCRKLIRESIGDLDYQLAVISCDVGVLPGAFLSEAKEKKIVILEDGTVDYIERYKWIKFRQIKNINDIAGFFLAKMGYANTAFCYEIYNTRYCEKFSSYPEKLKYRKYKSINKLNDMAHPDFDKELYYSLMDQAIDFDKEKFSGDAILFTTTYYGITKEYECVVPEVENYINKKYSGKTILLKKHPRDNSVYKFEKDVNIIEIDKNIPAEILAKRLNVNEYVYMSPSTAMLSFKNHTNQIYVLYFSELERRTRKEYDYKERFMKGLQICNIKNENVIAV